MSTTYRDQWIYHKPARKLGPINKKLVIPAFSFPCGPTRASLFLAGADGLTQDYFRMAFGMPVFTDVLTIEAWINLVSSPTGSQKASIFRQRTSLGDPQVALEIIAGRLIRFTLDKGGLTSVISTVPIPQNEWCFISGVWDGSNMRIYLNGVLVSPNQALVAPIDGGSFIDHYIGIDVGVSTNVFTGYINEVRLWQEGRTRDQILNSMFSPRNIVAGNGIDDTLKVYYKLNQTSGTTALESISNTNSENLQGNTPAWVTLKYFPLKYGASFVVARYTVTLDHKISFKYPITAPSNVNHSLVIQWTDNGVLKRRYLYKPSGVDYDSSTTQYLGEPVNTPFNIEIWNIDGNATVDLASDLTLYVSPTTQPTLPTDQISVVAATLSADSSLAEPFPWTNFPLEFNTQQTYT